MSDIGVSKIAYNEINKNVIVAYKNGNIDIIKENKEIVNLPFIKNSGTVGDKNINHIYFENEIAYLSTGIGIIVLNTTKLEIVDTYNFIPPGTNSHTNAVVIDDTNIYAASNQGVFYADKNNVNLSDFNNWNQIPELGSFDYNSLVIFNNQLFVGFDSPNWNSDTVFYNDSGIWKKLSISIYSQNLHGLKVDKNHLMVVSLNRVSLFDVSLNEVNEFYTFKGQFLIDPIDALIDDNNYIWMADRSKGLIKARDNWNVEQILPNSPTGNGAFALDFFDNQIWAISGGYNPNTYEPNYIRNHLVNYAIDNTWKNVPANILNSQGDPAGDAVAVAINKNNKDQVFVGMWSDGLFEFNQGEVKKIYTDSNSPLSATTNKIGAVEFDNNGNLWVANSYTNNMLLVKTPDDSWYDCSSSLMGFTKTENPYLDLVIDDNNYKWLALNRSNSIVVLDDNGTLDNTSDDQSVLLTPSNNGIPGARLHSMLIDLDGQLWIGTDEGIAVFYNPSEVFNQSISAERIFLQQDGQTQILLETEIITSMVVDGANRKWIGTQNSGVFLMSEDGTEEIEHFTTSNSPLFSNNILDLTINNKTGEVFIGTPKGLISYKGTATEADDDFNNVFVYPNPVRENFTGTIAIRGLVKDTDVRITDVSGNIVYQTTSLGGQAIWDGNDMHGNRVQTGVYLIFNGSQDGQKKHAAKILFIH